MINCTLRRSLSLLLALLVLLSCIPAIAVAEESTEPVTETTEPKTLATEETTKPETEVTEATTEPATEVTEETTEPATEVTEETTGPKAEVAEETTEPETEVTAETTEPLTTPSEEASEPTIPPVLPIDNDSEPKGPGLYFGQLHAHSTPFPTADAITACFQQAVQTDGLDFFAITDHSDSFDHAASGSIGDGSASSIWTAGKAAAQAVTGSNFVGIYGFEMSWPEQMLLGHISTFNTAGFQSWQKPPYNQQEAALKSYYDSLAATTGAIGQWNHPGKQYGTFFNFNHYSVDADRVIKLLEVVDGDEYYSQALDKGWHIAPTNNTASGRTVILAQALTENELYNAMNAHRVYATEDRDLEIRYSMNDSPMGSTVKKRHIGEIAILTADIHDPTDSAIGLVEVIVDGGAVAARQTVSNNSSTLQFALSTSYRYYYLRITQPDGEMAVTAPIWMDAAEHLGISDLSCGTAVPVQNEHVSLVLELYNRETADFVVDSIEILADGVSITEDTALTRIPAGSTLSHNLTFRYDGIGQTEITVVLSGTLEDAAREYTDSVSLSFRQSMQVTDIVMDGSHGNAGLSNLGIFKAIAAAEEIRVTALSEDMDAEMLKNCRFLLITAPAEPFSEDFLTIVADYIRYGGSVMICGQSAALDENMSSAEALNRLLETVGSTIRLNQDILTDSMYNGGDETLLFPHDINTDSPWCADISDAQVYCHKDGCSVSVGEGTALVSSSTAQSIARTAPVTVLAAEQTQSGGTILVAGSMFLGNTELNEPANIWDAPFANRTIARNLLGIGGDVLPLSTIRQVRQAEENTVFRIRGYVTAGTANRWNRFPNTLYLQDDTGGIAVIPFDGEAVAVGTPVEITGAAEILDGNRILKPISHNVLNTAFYRYLPKTGDWKTLLDTELHGGELVEVEGECTEVVLSDDNVVSDILLKDSSGNVAHVCIEDYIFSGATGKNDLHEDIQKGRKIRAMGILHIDENGEAVIRVRNCEEVVYVPPRKIYINPKTGDWLTQIAK